MFSDGSDVKVGCRTVWSIAAILMQIGIETADDRKHVSSSSPVLNNPFSRKGKNIRQAASSNPSALRRSCEALLASVLFYRFSVVYIDPDKDIMHIFDEMILTCYLRVSDSETQRYSIVLNCIVHTSKLKHSHIIEELNFIFFICVCISYWCVMC